MRIACACCGKMRDWPASFPADHYAQCFNCARRERAIESAKDQAATLFLAMMTAIFVGSAILQLFVARH